MRGVWFGCAAVAAFGCPTTPVLPDPDFCGDAQVQATLGEQCDDGLENNGDDRACTSMCQVAVCGDGELLVGTEECDLGDENADSAACTSACRLAVCGDGLVHSGVEECDEGTANRDVGTCTTACNLAACGDGFVQQDVENCDDGNVLGGDGCGPSCRLPAVVGATSADVRIVGRDANDRASFVSAAGDVNDDGLDDVLVAAPGVLGDLFAVGEVYLFLAPLDASLAVAQANATIMGPVSPFLPTGSALAVGVGDVDGDGFDDLGTQFLPSVAGEVFLSYGPLVGTENVSAIDDRLDANEPFPGGGAGWRSTGLAPLGDMNADGNDDFIVGEFVYTPTAGAARVIYGPVTGETPFTSSVQLSGEEVGDNAGSTVAGGDVTGDGVPDVLVGAPGRDVGETDVGMVYLVEGPVENNVDLALADARLVGESADDEAGWAMAFAGDVNGDGFGDILVGGRFLGTDRRGAAYLVYGPVVGTIDLSLADAVFRGEDSDDLAGTAVAGAGDVNGDGFADLLIGSTSANRAYLVLGPVAGSHSLATADVIFTGEASDDQFGRSVSFAGDVDGDGLTDILIGSLNDAGGEDAGAVYLWYGSSL